jgi:hypothetical protein
MGSQGADAGRDGAAYGVGVLSRLLIGAACAAGLAIGASGAVSGLAAAQPAPPPPPPAPNVNALTPVKPADYAVMDGNWYAFSTPGGAVCVVQRNGGYGCSGNLPGAPNGANLVSGGPAAPGFSTTTAPLYTGVGQPKPLEAGQRLSFQTVSCGYDGTVTACIDSRNQAGFVIAPDATWTLGATNPLLDRPQGTNPFFN